MLFKLNEKFSLNKLERKLNKLKRDPDLFLKDMISNQKEQVQKTIHKVRPVKPSTQNKFTIVSAVYNVGRYLDDYFESIVNQSVSFKDSVFIVCVDDGSTDHSAEIIKKWQKKYPRNIKYIYKENGGQSSARNLGLDCVKTDWVAFTDPDDFFHPNYIKNIDAALQKNNKIKMIVTNMIFYFEDQKIKKDSHPLRYRFYGKTTNFDIKKLENNMNLSVATSVFHMPEIRKNNLKFNPEVKPNFEDGKFIADYMLVVNGEANFLKDSIYYYRKRSDNSSTLDKSWEKPEKFYNVLKYGHLDMLMSYQKRLGHVPLHIQRTVLYDMTWYISYLLNSNAKTDFLTLEQRENFLNLLFKIFQFIDAETIMSFNLAGIWFKQKVGMLGYFKQVEPNFQIAYIENIDRENKQVLVSFFTTLSVDVSYKLNGKDVLPKFYKSTNNTFVGHAFVNENRAWLGYESLDDKLEIYINNKNVRLSLFGKQYHKEISIDTIYERFSYSLSYESNGSWILMDRDSKADDNAEHLYRYIKKNNLKNDIYFALSIESPDWLRLEAEGFNLLDFGSSEFEEKLKHCSKIISSHLNGYVENYFGDFYEYSKKVVFLQHGITKDDLSSWFNVKKSLRCLITATQPEYDSMALDNNYYKLTKKEVVLTGFPRHDALLGSHDNKTILIMPTWRSDIVGKVKGNSDEREVNDDFMQTQYASYWYQFIHSEYLKNLVDKYQYKVLFAPHMNIIPYLDQFEIPSYMNTWVMSDQSDSIQNLFKNSSILITDYSSVAFEMAYLEKPIIYFQFDKDTIFSGNHTYQKGYFEYERDGFGPVVEEVEQVEQALEQILQNDGQPLDEYLTRMQETFKFKDGRCCERVYNAIVALDHEDNSEDLELAHTFLNQAYEFKNYSLVQERAGRLLLHPELTASEKQTVYAKLAESYAQLKDWGALEVLLTEYHNDYYVTKLLATQAQWQEILNIVGHDIIADEYFTLRMSSLFNLNQLEAQRLQHLQIDTLNLSEYENNLSQCYVDYVNQDWESLVVSLENIQSDESIEFYTQDDFAFMHLMTGKHLNQLDLKVIQSLKSEKTDFILQKSLILSELNSADEALKGFALTEKNHGLSYFDLNSLQTYITDLVSKNDWKNLLEKLPECISLYPNEAIFKEHLTRTLGELTLWKDLVQFYKDHALGYSQCSLYFIILAHYRIGEIEEAYSLLVKPTTAFSYEYWLLALEVYMQVGDDEQVIQCLKRMYAIYPEKMKETKDKYNSLSQLFSLN